MIWSTGKFRPALGAALLGSAALALSPTAGFGADLSGTYTPPQASDYNFVDLNWGPWVELGGTYGTEQSSYGEAAIFAPLGQGADWLVFTELRGKYFEGDLIEGNAMLGVRKMTGAGFNLGGWLGLDVLNTDSDNTFWQVSGGLEALSQYFAPGSTATTRSPVRRPPIVPTWSLKEATSS